MPFDFAPDLDLPSAARRDRGRRAYEDGLSAEQIVRHRYAEAGYDIVAERFRGRGAEIDLIARGPDGYVFVEVKKAATHDTAAHRLGMDQLWRIARAGEDYIANYDDPFTPMRLDLAMVDGLGRLEVLENLTLY